MKKFTIIVSPEYEAQILNELGRARVVQLKEVTGVDFERLKKEGQRDIDYKGLYEKYHDVYLKLVESGLMDYPSVDATITELREFTEDPEGTVDSLLAELNELKKGLEKSEERLLETRTRLERVRALQPEEFRRSLAVGIVELQVIPRLVEHLERFDDLSHKLIEISEDSGYIFVFGPENRREWVETLYVVFDVKDIFEVLSTRDILLALDPEMREKVVKEYEEEVEKLQFLVEKEEGEEVIENQIEKIRDLVKITGKEQYGTFLGKARFYDYILGIMANETIPIVRTNVLSVIQGWIVDDKLPVFEGIIENLEEKTGELFFIQIEEPGHEDHGIPTPEPVMTPPILQPAWKLTSLRGWPSAQEINPMYITILIFSFQFGLMYGDIGQGAVFLLAGLIISRKFKRGMASKLGTLFIPMGLFAILFGIGYDSIFLVEGLLFHHHQFMPNPVEQTTTLMKWVFTIAAVELVFGLVLGAINQWKEGHKWGVLGEHGLGMILYVVGFYLSAMEFIRSGDFMGVMSYWAFYVMLGGMLMAMLEPIIAAVAGGHFTIEVIGEGVGALFMTFVEGLANLFSFLRIVAFALAHASLAGAAHQLAHFMGNIPSLILMNLIAMSFEFMSSGVQSLRLLYYEFMGKFFHGGGVPFRPYRLRIRRS